jgi:hypothetical protein
VEGYLVSEHDAPRSLAESSPLYNVGLSVNAAVKMDFDSPWVEA